MDRLHYIIPVFLYALIWTSQWFHWFYILENIVCSTVVCLQLQHHDFYKYIVFICLHKSIASDGLPLSLKSFLSVIRGNFCFVHSQSWTTVAIGDIVWRYCMFPPATTITTTGRTKFFHGWPCDWCRIHSSFSFSTQEFSRWSIISSLVLLCDIKFTVTITTASEQLAHQIQVSPLLQSEIKNNESGCPVTPNFIGFVIV